MRWLVVLLLIGCESVAPSRPDGGESFIALGRDFEGFQSWTRYEIDPLAVPIGHPEGPSFVYVNRAPTSGLTRFPVGTILIKSTEVGPYEDWILHAMVKRGGTFNLGGGSVGWEFLELRLTSAGESVILWRGEGPPSGLGYAAIGVDAGPDGVQLVCNDCHAAAWQNDSVLNPFVRLAP